MMHNKGGPNDSWEQCENRRSSPSIAKFAPSLMRFCARQPFQYEGFFLRFDAVSLLTDFPPSQLDAKIRYNPRNTVCEVGVCGPNFLKLRSYFLFRDAIPGFVAETLFSCISRFRGVPQTFYSSQFNSTVI